MNEIDRVKKIVKSIRVMQLATSQNKQPYLCTLHFYADSDFNLYWFSRAGRKHSIDIANNSKVSAYILIHEDTKEEPYVIWTTIMGEAKLVDKPNE
ncbi:pyridoxamine 5'-phosphate oxidase family protein, partial [Candidatus Saccharibacteria bacterium]|nr:pyridoxamine 5'-phosphate oxidase family protein [Candidatus Saccharibacteria bacterium]